MVANTTEFWGRRAMTLASTNLLTDCILDICQNHSPCEIGHNSVPNIT